MLPDDFGVLMMIRRAPILKLSRIIPPRSNLIDSLQDSRTCQQVIVADYESHDKWLIFHVSLQTGDINAYLVGDYDLKEAQPFIGIFQQALQSVFQGISFSFTKRLHIRRGLNNDPVLTAYLIARHLHMKGNYLNLDDERINLHKFEAFEGFRSSHDEYFGSFTFDAVTASTHPFVTKELENVPELIENGWAVIDVEGDGNCGYYALVLISTRLGE